MVIVAASNKYKITVKKAYSFLVKYLGWGKGKGDPFLKMKIITAILKSLDHWMWDPSNMIWEAVQV